MSSTNLDPKLINKWKKKIQRGFLRFIILNFFHERNEKGEFVHLHGWIIKERIARLTSNKWLPSNGSLYPALKELQSDGLIKLISGQTSDRNEYQITDIGRQIYQQIVDESPIMRPISEDFSRKVPKEPVKRGFKNVQRSKSKIELENMKERFEILIEALDELIKEK